MANMTVDYMEKLLYELDNLLPDIRKRVYQTLPIIGKHSIRIRLDGPGGPVHVFTYYDVKTWAFTVDDFKDREYAWLRTGKTGHYGGFFSEKRAK